MDKKNIFNEKKSQEWSSGPADQERIKKIIKLVGNNKIVLDLGCGDGEISQLLLKNHNQIFGVDSAYSAVKKAVKKGLQVSFCDVEKKDLPFKNNYFDVIIMLELLEHIFDPDALLKKVYRKLKSRGQLIISTPNLAAFGRRLLLLIGQNPLTETRLVEEYPEYLHFFPSSLTIDTTKKKFSAGHLRYFVKDSLFSLLKDHRFHIVKFTSDQINLTPNGKINSKFLAAIFPSLGKTLIVKAVKL